MSQMFVPIATPTPGSEVARSIEVTGSISVQVSPRHGPLTSKSVHVQFGDGGPVSGRDIPDPNDMAMRRATERKRAAGRHNHSERHGIGNHPLPHRARRTGHRGCRRQRQRYGAHRQPAIAGRDRFLSAGSEHRAPAAGVHAGWFNLGPDANVSLVQMALNTGKLEAVDNLSGNWSRWQKALSLTAGLHRFVVQARDAGGNVTQQVAFLNVLPVPVPPDPAPGSITSWTRLEPQCRNADMGRSVGARLFDPLWLMARQWQMGEFQAVDAGTPVQARVRATSAMLSRCHFGEVPANSTIRGAALQPLAQTARGGGRASSHAPPQRQRPEHAHPERRGGAAFSAYA